MRIGASILFKKGKCLQSYEWKDYRYLGDIHGVVEALDEYETDEIALLRIARNDESLKDFVADVKLIQGLESRTPVAFGGGIRSLEHLQMLKKLSVERIILSSGFLNRNLKLIIGVINSFGKQSLQCLLPFRASKGRDFAQVYISSENRWVYVSEIDFDFIRQYANEVIVYDVEADGTKNGFNFNFLNYIDFPKDRTVITGGIISETISEARKLNLASVIVDNKALHEESSIEWLKCE